MSRRAFGELELEILRILKNGERKSVKQVVEKLGGECKYTTVMTVMSRLAEKKRLLREKNGLQYEYWLPEERLISAEEVTQFKKKFLGVGTAALVSCLIDVDEEISDEELDAIQKLLEKTKKRKS